MSINPKDPNIDTLPSAYDASNSDRFEAKINRNPSFNITDTPTRVTAEWGNEGDGFTRTVQQRLSSAFINVREFGAVGDGAADDTTALTNAFATGLRIYYLPPGTYNVTGDIPVTNGSMVFAAGVTISGGVLLTPGNFTSIGYPSEQIVTQANVHVYNGVSNDDGNVRVGGLSPTVGLNIGFENVGSGRAGIAILNDAGGSNNTLKLGFGVLTSGSPANTVLTLNQLGELIAAGSIEVSHLKTVSGPIVIPGSSSPEGVTTAVIGSLFLRTDGGAGTTLYVKEAGAGNTGWVAFITSLGGDILADGSVDFTSTIVGITPTLSTHLATKGYVDAPTYVTKSAAEATPDVAGLTRITLGGVTTITDFLNGVDGQLLVCWNKSGARTIAHSASINLRGAINFAMTTDDVLTLSFDGSAWNEVSRTITSGSDAGFDKILRNGTRSFTGTQVGITPTLSTHLATKGYVDAPGITAFSGASATFDADEVSVATVDADATDITDFTNGVASQSFILIATGNRQIEHSASIALNGSADFDMVSGSTLTLVNDGSKWFETGRRIP